MVKRPKSPETVQETRIFTVYQPYPLNPNWIFEEDQIECLRWVVECIGNNGALWQILQKPSARSMILLEISKTDFTDHGRLLGEHRWNKMLKNPSTDEKGRVTQVFHSYYSRVRDAEKDGWKPFTADMGRCFKNWTPGEGRIVQPYPATIWCRNPVEDKTNKQLCRPIPVHGQHQLETYQPGTSGRPAPAVVGSSKWFETAAPATAPKALKPWADRPTNTVVTDIKINSDKTSPKSAFPDLTLPERTVTLVPLKSSKSTGSGPASRRTGPAQPTNPITKNTWGKAVPLNQFQNGKRGGHKGKTAWKGDQTTAGPALEQSKPANAWSKPPKLTPDPKVAKEDLTPPEDDEISKWQVDDDGDADPFSLNGQSWASAAATPVSGNTPEGTRAPSPDLPSKPIVQPSRGRHKKKKNTAPVPQSAITRSAVPKQEDPPIVHVVMNYEDDEGSDEDYVPYSQLTYQVPKLDYVYDEGAASGSGPQVNLWEYNDEDDQKRKNPDALECPVHKIACKAGICKEMSRMKANQRRLERQAEKERREREWQKKRDKAQQKEEQDLNPKEITRRVINDNEAGKELSADEDGFQMVAPNSAKSLGKQKAEPFRHSMRAFADDEEEQEGASYEKGWA